MLCFDSKSRREQSSKEDAGILAASSSQRDIGCIAIQLTPKTRHKRGVIISGERNRRNTCSFRRRFSKVFQPNSLVHIASIKACFDQESRKEATQVVGTTIYSYHSEPERHIMVRLLFQDTDES
jgi:hypothetical protein